MDLFEIPFERLKVLREAEQNLKLWREFDKKIKEMFMDNFHLGESSITIADYCQLQMDMGIIEVRLPDGQEDV